ncbi:uncharacterized protein LOC129581150 [Paramacrobiotus metropolitanus]|uniref:uncharacterized protein LOC129581150 n=1 Tax=Paramacrobiotus metropolitanus TaxID=2943436 RepID=UPI0024463EB0|nr:uncharacterized protein LOC129581150 [Paramacrobiotus metropolitanus]
MAWMSHPLFTTTYRRFSIPSDAVWSSPTINGARGVGPLQYIRELRMVCCGWWRRTPFISAIVALWGMRIVVAVNRYYGTYLYSLWIGDMIMTPSVRAHGASNLRHRKWHIECMDGEAVVGNRKYRRVDLLD